MKLRQYLFNLLIAFLVLLTGINAQINGGTSISNHMFYESNTGDSIIHYKGYSVIYSYAYNLPRYTFNCLTIDQINLGNHEVARRGNKFFPQVLPNGESSPTNIDYSKTGYDRGHMVPAGDFVWEKALKDETFNYTNINLQKPSPNRGIWANLEDKIRERALSLSENAYIVTGVTFNTSHCDSVGPNTLPVPVSFFKIVYFKSKNIMHAFLFDNTVDSYMGNISDFQVSVDFFEEITGEDFFDLLDDKNEKVIESKINRINE